MSVVLCLPAHLRVSRSVPWPAPHGNASVLVWLTLRGKNFVACKIAPTYGKDLSLEGGVGLYNTVILI